MKISKRDIVIINSAISGYNGRLAEVIETDAIRGALLAVDGERCPMWFFLAEIIK